MPSGVLSIIRDRCYVRSMFLKPLEIWPMFHVGGWRESQDYNTSNFASMVELVRVSRLWTFELSLPSRNYHSFFLLSSFFPPLTKRPLSPLR